VSHRVYLTLGSDVNAEWNLPAGLARLLPHGVEAISGVFETAAVGTSDHRLFLNAAALVVTDLAPEEFKRAVCRRIEDELGRIRNPSDRFAPRTIDLDIALWDDAVRDVLGSAVPDPDILRHLHVAWPLADLAPELVHPLDGRTLAAIAAALAAEALPSQLPVRRAGVRGWDLPG
jgi:2-amino-4-hydroxy-6-hydroxymethyldihydropteridine diphosphokinase